MKQKIKTWLQNQTKGAKLIFLVTLLIHLISAIYNSISKFSYVLSYGLDAFAGRLLGTFLGTTMPLLLVSTILALIPYFIFRKVAEKYKKYLDYFAVTFLIISIIILYFGNSWSLKV